MKTVKAKISGFALCFLLVALSSIARSQGMGKIVRIGYLGGTTSNSEFNLERFRERLRELGYAEGRNLVIEVRHHQGNVDRLPELAAELVRLQCDVIVTNGTEAAETAKTMIRMIPVVMGFSADAVQRGIIADLAHPGGNITGLTDTGSEINGKRLELLKETVPKLSRVGLLWVRSYPGAEIPLKETETVARTLNLAIQSLEVKEPQDIEAAFQLASKNRLSALLVTSGGLFGFHRNRIIGLAQKSRLPATYDNNTYVQAGGLMSYTADRKEQFRRAAEYVDRILKGAKPAELPVERPRKFEFTVNLKAAKQIGLTIPPNVLARADRVIR